MEVSGLRAPNRQSPGDIGGLLTASAIVGKAENKSKVHVRLYVDGSGSDLGTKQMC